MKDSEAENLTGELTANQESALAALLAHGTVAAAAAACQLAESTLWRFLQLPAFVAAYREARAQLVDATIARLQSAGQIAVDTLCQIAQDKAAAPGARIAAARAILAGGMRGLQLTQEAAAEAEHIHLCPPCNKVFSCTDRKDAEFEMALCPSCKLDRDRTTDAARSSSSATH
jgi:hypothetical protein